MAPLGVRVGGATSSSRTEPILVMIYRVTPAPAPASAPAPAPAPAPVPAIAPALDEVDETTKIKKKKTQIKATRKILMLRTKK